MEFPAVRLASCFPESYGFVLLDPARLDEAFGGSAAGRNVLELFATSGLGDRVAVEGIAIPVPGLEAGYYSVLVRHRATPCPWPAPRLSAAGWVLGTTTGALLLCGAGYLTQWNPDDPRHHHLDVPRAWYAVDIHAHLLDHGPDDGAYEFVLNPTQARPPFHARLDHRFGRTAPTHEDRPHNARRHPRSNPRDSSRRECSVVRSAVAERYRARAAGSLRCPARPSVGYT